MHYSVKHRAFREVVVALVPALALAGCMGTSPGMQVASFAGGSLVSEWTGKSLSDHALSLAVSRDCEFLRLIEGRPLCRDYVERVGLETTERRGPPVPTSPPAGAAAKPTPVTAATMTSRRSILVLGRFRSRRNAEAIAAEYAQLKPRVVSGAAVGTPWEVHVGPVTVERGRALTRALAEVGEPPLAVLAFTPRLATSPARTSSDDAGVPGLVRAAVPPPPRGEQRP